MARLQHFGWFFSRGFGPQGWDRPYQGWNWDWRRPELYQQSVRDLEQAGLDLVIAEDALSLGNADTLDLRVRRAYGGPKHDPLMLAPYLFAATSRIGIAPTVNAAQVPPYTAARQFATLQHLSGHRFGINVVTDVGSARHFGTAAPLGHDAAYDRAEEWIDAIRRLWHSWDEGALVEDAVTGHYADGSRIRPFQHRGEYFELDGPLNAVPFEDGDDPVIVSPGGSPRGLGFAGARSQVQLALAPMSAAAVRDYRAKVHGAARAAGRTADQIRVLFVFKPEIVASTAEAQRIVEASRHPSDDDLLTVALGQSSDLETDLTKFDLDAPVDPAAFGEHVSQGSIRGLTGGDTDAPLRELLTRKARKGRIADRDGVVGTADEVADFIEELGTDAQNDGIIFSGDLHPVGVHRMLDDIVPVLRRRGILRAELGDGGLRANLFDF